MKIKEALHKSSQELKTDTAEIKTSTASLYGYSFGTIFSEYLIEVRASPTKVSWIYNLFHVSACLGSVMGDTLVEEFGWRKVIFASGLLSSLGMVLSVFTTSADFLFFSYSILAGCLGGSWWIIQIRAPLPHHAVTRRLIVPMRTTAGQCGMGDT
ncbi:Monocarboxylate transporter 13 [Portunus trituberculatus]|uniref:Monocarboxylate transporter 13 n=1 Tax=Portunus trituberculatus TaxID=210409 RepID=A0A5B7F0S2_PORTR|nr:Monocarboxylate transporter 13 [Portunus trituberculatus]